MEHPDLMISGFALIISILSAAFAVLSWREAHRPIVIARVTTAKSGSVATALSLLIENTGNRPAREIVLTCRQSDLETALALAVRARPPDDVTRVFASDTVIPVLAHGGSVECAFGLFSSQEQSTWLFGSRLRISISYRDLGRRRFNQPMTLLLADDHSFTGLAWAQK